MKHMAILLAVVILQSCEKKLPTSKDELVTEWSKDGKTLMIMRKGVQIATFRNASNDCYVDLSGPDGVVDATVFYYEGDSSSGGAERKNIVLGWRRNDGTMKTVAYDGEGDIVKPSPDPK
jgi:hypothetical protein